MKGFWHDLFIKPNLLKKQNLKKLKQTKNKIFWLNKSSLLTKTHNKINMKQVLREQKIVSTSHDLPNAIRNQHIPMKTMWFISFILSTALCSYLIIQTIMEYLEFDVITKVRIVGDTEAEFPLNC